MATSSGNYHLEPTYKQHTAVDDKAGVLIDVDLTTGEINEGTKLVEVIERIEIIVIYINYKSALLSSENSIGAGKNK
jgi:Transposase DDE domain